MELTEEKVQKAMDKMPFPSPYTAKEWLEHLYLENYRDASEKTNHFNGWMTACEKTVRA